jgi:hypothetical protein
MACGQILDHKTLLQLGSEVTDNSFDSKSFSAFRTHVIFEYEVELIRAIVISYLRLRIRTGLGNLYAISQHCAAAKTLGRLRLNSQIPLGAIRLVCDHKGDPCSCFGNPSSVSSRLFDGGLRIDERPAEQS